MVLATRPLFACVGRKTLNSGSYCSKQEKSHNLSYCIYKNKIKKYIYSHIRINFRWCYTQPRGPVVLCRSPECWRYAELEQAWKYKTICCISFHSCRSIKKQIWPRHKNGQGQPKVIIWTNLVVLEYPMLYTKFEGYQWRLHTKFCFNRPSVLCGIVVWKYWIWVTLDKGQWMTLTLGCHKSSRTHLFDFYLTGFNSFSEFYSLSIFPIQKQKGPTLTLL